MNNTTQNPAAYCPVVCDEEGELWTDSLIIAEAFERNHRDVLRSIDQLVADGTIGRRNFAQSSYYNLQNKPQRMIRLDERGFLIAMPFIGGRRARQGQVRLVDEFLTLRRQITKQTEQRLSNSEQRLTAIEQALFRKHPHWPTILRCKAKGMSHRMTCIFTKHKDPDTIRRNLRRMEECGIAETH
ncbi:MAG: Rha family transcriptional regulator [Magnetococcales bacterium]|nr:Rha family transcriptional regulator [Magnetococcales bacterium]